MSDKAPIFLWKVGVVFKVNNMEYAVFDKNKFPIVSITFTGIKSTDDNFRDYLNQIKNIYDQQMPFILIFDATNASLPGFKHQLMQANWLKENDSLIKTYCLGTVYIISNSLVRGILKSIFALQKQPCPYLVVGNIESANSFIEVSLAAAKIKSNERV